MMLRRRDDTTPNLLSPSVSRGVASPFSSSELHKIVLTDIYGGQDFPVTRLEAMSVPAVARARHLITGISRFPVKAYRGEEALATQPSWLYRTNGNVPPQLRMLWTIDDLMFNGWALWAVERGAPERDGARGPVIDALRVPPAWWKIDPDTGEIIVTVDGEEKRPDQDSVILIPGPFEGLLPAGADTIRSAKNLERAWAKRVRQPIPASELHQTTEDPLTDPEIVKLIDSWGAMLDEGGGVAYTPNNIEFKAHGTAVSDLFIEGRNAVTLDIARLLNVPAMMLDASMATSSLQYVTAVDGRNAFIDITVAYWIMTIEARLSMDDVVPRGQRVGFDLANLTALPQPASGPATED